jgi:DNA modification methylase
LQADGWYLRSDVVWSKPNPTPESVRDRPTRSHEYVFLLAKSRRYYYDRLAASEPLARSSLVRLQQQSSDTQIKANDKSFRRLRADSRSIDRAIINLKGRMLPPSRSADRTPVNPANPMAFRRNLRSVWTIATKPFRGQHFATYPDELIRPCIRAGCPLGGTVLDPFMGAGTTGLVARQEGRQFIGIELKDEYVALAEDRLRDLGHTTRSD